MFRELKQFARFPTKPRLILKSKPYERAAMERHVGVEKMSEPACAMNPKTVKSGKVKTSVCFWESADHFAQRSTYARLPARKQFVKPFGERACARRRMRNREGISQTRRAGFPDSIRTARAAISQNRRHD